MLELGHCITANFNIVFFFLSKVSLFSISFPPTTPMFTCVRSSSLYSVMSAVDSRGSLKRPLLLQPPWGEWEHVFFSGLFFFGGDSCMWTLSRRAISTVTFDTLLGSVWQGWSAKISVVLHYRPPGAVEEHCYPLFLFFSRGVLVETRKFPLTHQQPLVSRAGPAVSDFLVKSVAERPIAAFRSVLHTKCMQNKRWATNLCFPEDRWGEGGCRTQTQNEKHSLPVSVCPCSTA